MIRCLTDSDFVCRAKFFKKDATVHAKWCGFETLSDYLYVMYCEEGWSIRHIADELMYSETPVARCIRAMGIEVRGYREAMRIEPERKVGRRRKYTDEQVEMAKKWRREGKTFGWIASELNCAHSQAFRMCKGVTR